MPSFNPATSLLPLLFFFFFFPLPLPSSSLLLLLDFLVPRLHPILDLFFSHLYISLLLSAFNIASPPFSLLTFSRLFAPLFVRSFLRYFAY